MVAAAFDREIKEGQIQSIQVDSASRDPRRGRRRHGRPSRCVGPGVQRAGFGRRERARHRAGRFGTQYLGGRRWQGRHARAARRAFRLLSVAAHHLHRAHRPGRGGSRAARADRRGERAPARRIQARPAAARHHGQQEDAAGRAGHRPRSKDWKASLDASPLAGRYRANSSSTCTSTTCRTPSSSTAPPTTAWRSIYAEWLEAGIHVVTPNKKANSGPLAYYDSLKEARRLGGSSYLYEATVGAGLPVIQTLRDLRETGDKIDECRGHLLRHAGLSIQRVRRQDAVLADRQGRQGQGLHRARSARRPVRHRLRAQGHHSRPRDGPQARDEGRAGREPDSGAGSRKAPSTISSMACRSTTAR